MVGPLSSVEALGQRLFFRAGRVVGRVSGPNRPWGLILGVGLLLFMTLGTVVYELRTSRIEASYLSQEAGRLHATIGPGPSSSTRFPTEGPYDLRYGYVQLPEVVHGLTSRGGFVVDSQARVSDQFARLMGWGLSPIYRSKDAAGFRIVDRSDQVVFDGQYPARIYRDFDSIPPLVWKTLLFVENKTLLDPTTPYRNPAVDWPRLVAAVAELGGKTLGRDGSVAGASTLATQLEKFRHGSEGRTLAPGDKLRQMASASLRIYLDGPETLDARRRIVTSYLNSIPLAGIAGYGEVTGLGDGLWAWFGADFDQVNAVLRGPADPARQGAAYRQVLDLLMALQRPSYFLADSTGRRALARRAERYLDLMAKEGAISPALRDAARAAPVVLRSRAPERRIPTFVERKAVNAVRTELLAEAGVPALYQLDRFDLTARTTFDAEAQASATKLLTDLTDPAFVRARGLAGYRLLEKGDPNRVKYAFLLFERTSRGNVVRIQADNVEAPFSPIEGAKLELGSTAKLRTLVTYLELIERLYREHAGDSIGFAHDGDAAYRDPLTVWAREYLTDYPDASLTELLGAAMDRRYSANPAERFYTGGGVQTFQNFESKSDGTNPTVREALQQSVNLAFIRMMRDIVDFHIDRLPGHPARALDDRTDPRRREYLARFADREGRRFLEQFFRKHDRETREEALATLIQDRALSPERLAWTFRIVAPTGTFEEFAQFLADATGPGRIAPARARALFERTDPSRLSLADQGFVAGVHPLELWLVEFRLRHPDATWAMVMDSSRQVRQEVYRWLFATPRTRGQDERIRSILEIEAFSEIHRSWQRLGYPFASLVPSYATAIGSSADRPDQLAELVGILLNDGVRRPSLRIDRLRFAVGTPYEVVLRHPAPPAERLLAPEIAREVRQAMIEVVEKGTARRAYGAVVGPDGTKLTIGAKTGTGNNRFRVFGPGGRIVEDRAINRTSTLVFFVGDRFFGTLTAFVPGAEADGFGFTSSLPAQVLQMLGPTLSRLAARPTE